MRNEKQEAVFRQCLYDFPCPVTLGKNKPSFGLHRFKQGLRFEPSDDEGFTLRGDRRRLVYKGRRRSHRFTILGDGAFEYDCILLKEPDSNIISLHMEGAENYDFFRQPDFVRNPFLKGSYAVYKKETLVGEGTGKLCHIHRPEIIDARGRRCWGDIAVDGNELHITIPEKWLSEAKYPVIVDPAVGTTTVGSQYEWEWEPGEPLDTLYFDVQIPVNRFLVSEPINGVCTAYFYTNYDDDAAGAYPVLYSDNGNKPLAKISKNENYVNLRVTENTPEGWRPTFFKSGTEISSGSYIWFGAFTYDMWYPRFDYGSRCYKDYWDTDGIIPETYPLFDANNYYDLKVSMYFNYSPAQNYVRTLTQGVTLSESRKLKSDYKRPVMEMITGTDTSDFSVSFIRAIFETKGISESIQKWGDYFRGLYIEADCAAITAHRGEYYRKETDTVRAVGSAFRHVMIFVKILTTSFVRDYFIGRFLVAKTELIIKSCVVREMVIESRINEK